MSRHPHTSRALLAALALAVLLATAVPPAAAQASDAEEDDGLLPDVGLGDLFGAIEGSADRYVYWATTDVLGVGDDGTATETADEIDGFAAEHEQSLVTYANAHVPENATLANYDALRLDLEAGGETETVWVVVTHANGSIDAVDVVRSAPNASIDYTLGFDEFATRELPEDLEMVHGEYVQPDEDPTPLRSFVASKYGVGDHVTVTEGDAA